MKILDVSPRVAFPPQQGSCVRMYNLLRHLSRRHEVRQFSQVRWQNRRVQRAPREVRLSPSYLEYRYADPAASLLCDLAERAWVRAPVLAGAALRLRRPRALRQLLEWADVTLVEFPWQFRFCRQVRPRGPLVVGPVSRPGVEANVVATGRVPDMAPFLRAADISVCPIRFGGGTKIKLLESMGAGLPTVAFAESIHGLAVRENEHLLIAGRSEAEWLAALELLADDPALAHRLGHAAATFVTRHHDWSRIADGLKAALLRLLEVHRDAGGG